MIAPDSDLAAAVATIGASVIRVARISPLASGAWNRSAFRIELAGGSVVKGRTFASPEAASRYVELTGQLPDGVFPRHIAIHGTAVLREWIDGTPLPEEEESATGVAERAGSILRRIHDVRRDRAADEPPAYPAASWRRELTSRVERLVGSGLLRGDEGDALLDGAAATVPGTSATVLVVGDLAPENIVIDRRGALRIVDDDGVDVHARAFDLTRVWYRWPMHDEAWAAFERGYGSAATFADWRRHLQHWAIVVLTAAADFRLRHALPDPERPLLRLRELIGTARSGVTP